MYKRIGLVLTVIVIGIILAFIITRKPKDLIITTVKESYNTCSLISENDFIEINLYINQKDPMITDKQRISKVYITDKDLGTVINAKVESIDLQGKIKLENKDFYCYKFIFVINNLKSDIEINDAFLQIHFFNNKSLNINIGSVSIYKIDNFDSSDLRIINLKGIVNIINNKKTLVGIIIGLENKSGGEVIIKDVKPLDLNLYCSDWINVNGKNINSNDNISNYLDYKYSIKNSKRPFNIKVQEKEYFLFPLSYKKHYEIPRCGLKITYEIYGKEKKMYYEEFQFFINHERFIDINSFTFYHYENN
ncbi:MAG TPA: hypothetical protein GXZ48_08110 [Acholeplasmataceae bacterium]|nr:hypothetical protein [Acholeplasmataceae bacterium]